MTNPCACWRGKEFPEKGNLLLWLEMTQHLARNALPWQWPQAYLIRNCHDLGSLLAKAESYRTQWATGSQVNGTTARQIEQTQANANAAQEAARSLREKGEGKKNAFL